MVSDTKLCNQSTRELNVHSNEHDFTESHRKLVKWKSVINLVDHLTLHVFWSPSSDNFIFTNITHGSFIGENWYFDVCVRYSDRANIEEGNVTTFGNCIFYHCAILYNIMIYLPILHCILVHEPQRGQFIFLIWNAWWQKELWDVNL